MSDTQPTAAPTPFAERLRASRRDKAAVVCAGLTVLAFVVGGAVLRLDPFAPSNLPSTALLVIGMPVGAFLGAVNGPGPHPGRRAAREALLTMVGMVLPLVGVVVLAPFLDGVPERAGAALLALAVTLAVAAVLLAGRPERANRRQVRKGIAYAAILVAVFAAGLVMVVVSGYGEPRQLLVTVPVAAGAAILAVVLLRRNAAEARAAAGAHPPDPA